MNISGGKGVLKFFSKKQKGVSETEALYKNEIEIHAKAILQDGRLYNTETATLVCDCKYGLRSLFITKNKRWFTALCNLQSCGSRVDENGNLISEYKKVYYDLSCASEEYAKEILSATSIELYKKYFGEVEEG